MPISMASLVFAIAAGLCLAWTAGRRLGKACCFWLGRVHPDSSLSATCSTAWLPLRVGGTVFGESFNDMPGRFPSVGLI